MKLVLQCAVCGTNHAVGTTVCATCRAAGLQNLRLLFECPRCYGVGLSPRCEACHPSPPPVPYEVVPDPRELALLWGVDSTHAGIDGEVLVPEFVDEPDESAGTTDEEHTESEYELVFDEEESDDPDEDLSLDKD